MRKITRLGPTSGSFATWLSVISEAILSFLVLGLLMRIVIPYGSALLQPFYNIFEDKNKVPFL